MCVACLLWLIMVHSFQINQLRLNLIGSLCQHIYKNHNEARSSSSNSTQKLFMLCYVFVIFSWFLWWHILSSSSFFLPRCIRPRQITICRTRLFVYAIWITVHVGHHKIRVREMSSCTLILHPWFYYKNRA